MLWCNTGKGTPFVTELVGIDNVNKFRALFSCSLAVGDWDGTAGGKGGRGGGVWGWGLQKKLNFLSFGVFQSLV